METLLCLLQRLPGLSLCFGVLCAYIHPLTIYGAPATGQQLGWALLTQR